MRYRIGVLAIALVLALSGTAAAQAELYEITWESSGFNHQTDPGWNLSGSGYAILGPVAPYERSSEFSPATHILLFTHDRHARGGQLPGPDGPFSPPAPPGSPSLACSNAACGGSLSISGDTFTASWHAGGHIVNVSFSATGRRITSPPAATTQYLSRWLSFTESASLVGTGVGTLQVFPPLPGQPGEPAYRLTIADRAGATPRAVTTIIGEDFSLMGGAVRTEALPVALSGVSGARGGGSFRPTPSPGSVGSPPDGPDYFVVELAGLGVKTDGTGTWTQFIGHGSLTAAITSPVEDATVSGTITVAMAAAGASGSTTFALAVDGSVVSTQTVSGSTASYAWNTTTVASGPHTLTLTVTDALGRSATATRRVTVGSTGSGLKVALTSPKPGATVSGTVAVNIWVEGAAAGARTFTLAVDGNVIATQTCTCVHVWPAWNTTLSTNGTHTLTATVRDSQGRTGTTSLSVTVKN